ncbi:Elongator complex protein 4 [Podospora australis]|uniref:Elongator complex protein 4 n=1 Tax=Podospora australis TaxID=1536484 RepID=A0AAN6X5L7_9PEZI|nr:Elongator complex protein 4 [Podospora australis]
MSFVKRNTVLSARPGRVAPTAPQATPGKLAPPPGVRPSPLDGRPTTSTGTLSLDQLLAGHSGLPLGTSLLIEEQGTTDFAGTLLRYYGAEGLVQGHHVHLVGYPPEYWRRNLPGLAEPDSKSKASQPAPAQEEKMKIAWRYEALGNSAPSGSAARGDASQNTFCHSFDITKRLLPASFKGTLQPTPSTGAPSFDLRAQPKSQPAQSPLKAIIKHLQTKLEASSPRDIHRVIIPNILSPEFYAQGCTQPSEVLQFFHALRALLRKYSTQLTVIITLQALLFPRSSGLVRWMELLSDGVLELIPLPATPGAAPPPKSSSEKVDTPQGLLKVHSLPIYHEKGGGGAETSSFREALSFSLSATKGLNIKPYSLPPMMEEDDKKEKSPASTVKDGIDF